MSTQDEYVQRKLQAVSANRREILEALQVLNYRLVPIGKDEDGDPAWIVMHNSPGSRSVQVKEHNIDRRWMLHVTLEDIHEVEKYAVDQMWAVVDLYRAMAENNN